MNWFLRDGLKPVGPFTEEEMREKILRGDLSPEDWIWKDGVADWLPANVWPEFRLLPFPALEGVGSVGDQDREWIVLEKTTERGQTTGPWSMQEIRRALADGRLRPNDAIWKKGMNGWARLSSRPEVFTSPSPEIPSLL